MANKLYLFNGTIDAGAGALGRQTDIAYSVDESQGPVFYNRYILRPQVSGVQFILSDSVFEGYNTILQNEGPVEATIRTSTGIIAIIAPSGYIKAAFLSGTWTISSSGGSIGIYTGIGLPSYPALPNDLYIDRASGQLFRYDSTWLPASPGTISIAGPTSLSLPVGAPFLVQLGIKATSGIGSNTWRFTLSGVNTIESTTKEVFIAGDPALDVAFAYASPNLTINLIGSASFTVCYTVY